MRELIAERLRSKSPPYKSMERTKGKRRLDSTLPSPPLPTLVTHSFILAVRAPSSSDPSTITLPTPDSSRNLRKRLSHLGLASKTRTLQGPSHPTPPLSPLSASHSYSGGRRGIATSWKCRCRTSTCHHTSFGYMTDLQCPVRICAGIRASAFLALFRQDFFGGGGGISSIP